MNPLKVYVSSFFSTGAKGDKILPSPKQSHKDNMTFDKAHFKFHMSPIKKEVAHNNSI